MTLKLAVSRSRPSVQYGANVCVLLLGSRMFVMWCAGTLLTIYVIDTFILSHFRTQTVSTGKPVDEWLFSVSLSWVKCLTWLNVTTVSAVNIANISRFVRSVYKTVLIHWYSRSTFVIRTSLSEAACRQTWAWQGAASIARPSRTTWQVQATEQTCSWRRQARSVSVCLVCLSICLSANFCWTNVTPVCSCQSWRWKMN